LVLNQIQVGMLLSSALENICQAGLGSDRPFPEGLLQFT
jgi:hypothetical protein